MLTLVVVLGLVVQGSGLVTAYVIDDTVWRTIQLRQRMIQRLEDDCVELERQAHDKLAAELKRRKAGAADASELSRMLSGALPATEVALALGTSSARPVSLTAGASRDLQRFVTRWRRGLARALFTLCRSATREGLDGTATRIAERCVTLDPEHELAREVLGHVRTKHGWETGGGRWQIETALPPEVQADAAALLRETERSLRVVLGDRFDLGGDTPIRVLLFPDREDYEAEIDEEHPDSARFKLVDGFFHFELHDERFLQSHGTVHVSWNEEEPLKSRRLLIHEATHALMSSVISPTNGQGVIGPGDAVEEAVALCAEMFALPGALLESEDEPGSLPELHDSLTSGRRCSLRTVLDESMADAEGRTVDEAYHDALALALFCGACRADNPIPWQLQAYLVALRQGDASPELFALLMGDRPWDELEAEWAAHLDTLSELGQL